MVLVSGRCTPNSGSTTITTEGASVILSAGSKLDMRDNALGTFNIIEGATFGLNGLTASATSNLYFDIGSVSAVSGVYGGADKITITKNAAITSGATINLNAVTGATGITTGVIQLITAGSGFTGTGTNNFTLSSSTLTLSGAWGSKTYNLSLAGAQNTTTQTALNVSIVAPTTAYWSGALDGSWGTNNAGGVTNWRTDATSDVDTQATPDATTNVFFNTTTPVASNLTTSNLTSATSIASLTFTSSATGAVTIGNNGSDANTLTIGVYGLLDIPPELKWRRIVENEGDTISQEKFFGSKQDVITSEKVTVIRKINGEEVRHTENNFDAVSKAQTEGTNNLFSAS